MPFAPEYFARLIPETRPFGAKAKIGSRPIFVLENLKKSTGSIFMLDFLSATLRASLRLFGMVPNPSIRANREAVKHREVLNNAHVLRVHCAFVRTIPGTNPLQDKAKIDSRSIFWPFRASSQAPHVYKLGPIYEMVSR